MASSLIDLSCFAAEPCPAPAIRKVAGKLRGPPVPIGNTAEDQPSPRPFGPQSAVSHPRLITARMSPLPTECSVEWRRKAFETSATSPDTKKSYDRFPSSGHLSFCSVSSLTPRLAAGRRSATSHRPAAIPLSTLIPPSYSSDPQDDPSLFSPDRWADEIDEGPLKHHHRDTSGVWPGDVVCASVRTRTVTESSDMTEVESVMERTDARAARNRASHGVRRVRDGLTESRVDDSTLWEIEDRASVLFLTPIDTRRRKTSKMFDRCSLPGGGAAHRPYGDSASTKSLRRS